jgi:hypothetical protein
MIVVDNSFEAGIQRIDRDRKCVLAEGCQGRRDQGAIDVTPIFGRQPAAEADCVAAQPEGDCR